MKSRITTILTTALLVAVTGGAIAVGESGSHGGPQGGAASGQYKPGKGCGDKNHKHKKHAKCKKKHKAKHTKKTHKAPPKPKKNGNSNCTIRKGPNGVELVYCP